jgi:hypothetical protein
MVSAASVVANGGTLFEPHLVRAVIRDDRREVVALKPLRRVISAETAATMTTVMEGSSSAGPANSRLEGFQVARQDGNRVEAGQRTLFNERVHRVVRRVCPVASTGTRNSRVGRHATQWLAVRRDCGGADLSSHRGGRPSSTRRDADDQSASRGHRR